jgi:hypothetical protein
VTSQSIDVAAGSEPPFDTVAEAAYAIAGSMADAEAKHEAAAHVTGEAS